ncbi:MAG: iron dicitrate transport regulator FecR [Planctomycetota bacterium]|nr:iron dicitrate transport regulator FecR [Planctomycetota bacterium]MDA1163780.1 iron dicitrate transport regulator FecR [Planctomycetota bacterium]
MSERVQPIDDELIELFEAVANRVLTPAQQERLAERLAADSDARAAFIHATAFDAMLSHEFPAAQPRVASSALELSESEVSRQIHDTFPARAKSRTKLLILALVSVAATVLLAIALTPFEISLKPVATLASSENAAWESSLPTTPGSELTPGSLKLIAGIATIRFHSGAVVILEAPAQLEVISPMRGKLVDGAAVIDVPETAIGFVIETPDGYAIDYGTRFAVQVDRAAQRSNFQLIEGEIAVHHSGTGEEVRLTEPHRTVSVHEDSVSVIDLEQQSNTTDATSNVIRIGTNGRATSVLRNNKRRKFLDPEVLAVKNTENGKWNHRSFFAFDLSSVDVGRLKAARLRLNLVPSQRGFASRLPLVNRFGIYGLTNPARADWKIESTWEDAPAPEDGVLLGTFEIHRSQQRGTFGIANSTLVEFLQQFHGQSVTLILVRETTQVEGEVPGLTHVFASDAHPETVGPLLELSFE